MRHKERVSESRLYLDQFSFRRGLRYHYAVGLSFGKIFDLFDGPYANQHDALMRATITNSWRIPESRESLEVKQLDEGEQYIDLFDNQKVKTHGVDDGLSH